MDINKLCPHCMREVVGGELCPHCGKNIKVRQEFGHQLPPFTILNGKYLIGDALGEGSSGITYIGVDITLELRVAIKEFFVESCMTRHAQATTQVTIMPKANGKELEEKMEAFLREVRSLAKCRELPGIVDVRDYFDENNTTYFVQEFLDGMTLQDYAVSMGGRIPFDILMSAMETIVIALEQVHEQGLTHCAICPNHIMRLNDGSLKLFGFGATYPNSAYMPEEQLLEDGNIGSWSDVYALCATFYKCLTGVSPVRAVDRKLQDTLQSPSSLGVNIPHPIELALLQGMAIRPEQRIRNMNALHKALYSNYVSGTSTMSGQADTKKREKMTNTVSTTATVSVSEKNKTPLILGIVSGVIVLFTVLVFAMVLIGQGQKKADSAQETITNQVETTEQLRNEAKQENEQGASEEDANLGEIMQHFEQAQDWSSQAEVFPEYYSFLDENEVQEDISKQIADNYTSYCTNLSSFLDNMEAAEPSPAIYGEMSMDLQAALEIAEELEKRGISVEYSELQERENNLILFYTQKLCERYDMTALNAIQNNGQISRSELWKIMEGADSCGIYRDDDVCNPVRTRYASALALHVDSELEGKSAAEAVQLLYENLEQTQYSPLLLYYLTEVYAEEGAISMYEQECELLKESASVDFTLLDDVGKRNFVYWFSLEDYDSVRQEIISEIGAVFYNPYE